MSFPKIVYHKNYDRLMEERLREDHAKKVQSEAELKQLGPDWGHHPSVKASVSLDEKPIKSKKAKAE